MTIFLLAVLFLITINIGDKVNSENLIVFYIVIAVQISIFCLIIRLLASRRKFSIIIAIGYLIPTLILSVPNIRLFTHIETCAGDISDSNLVIHAGGRYVGYEYLHAQESLTDYLDQGYDRIELDFLLTADGKVVCTHMWEYIDGYDMENRPTIDEFAESQILGEYRPITFKWLISTLKEYPDVKIIVDTKDDMPALLEKMVAGVSKSDFDIFDRFIVYIFSYEDYLEIMSKDYPFSEYWFANYKINYSASEISRYFDGAEEISTYCLQYNTWFDFIRSGNELNKDIAIHTIRNVDFVKFAYLRGVKYFLVDSNIL